MKANATEEQTMKALTDAQRMEADEAIRRVMEASTTSVIKNGLTPREALDRHLYALAETYPAAYLRIRRRLRELAA